MMKWQRFLVLLCLTAVIGTVVAAPAAGSVFLEQLIINEVDYDQPSLGDAEEFIEITNIGSTPADLSQYRLDLIDDDGFQYATINLPAVTLPPGEYYVVCKNQSVVIHCDQEVTVSILNGAPNAVALLVNGLIAVDKVSYEGDTPGYTEGSGIGLEDNGALVMMSIARYPNAVDTNQNNLDFSPRCITPGLPNIAQATDCAALYEPAVTVTLTAVPSSVPEPGGPVSFTVRVDNEGLLEISLETLTDAAQVNLNGQGSCQTPQTILPGGAYTCVYSSMVTGENGEHIPQTVTAAGVDSLDVPFSESGQTAVTITQRTRWDAYLPVIVSPLLYGEPNNHCDEAYPLSLNQTGSFLAEDINDWYVFELSQSDAVQVIWHNFIPAEGQITVWRGVCGDLVLVGNDGSTAVNRTLNLGQQPPGRYLIWLINDGPLNNTDFYTLRVQTPSYQSSEVSHQKSVVRSQSSVVSHR